MPFANIFPAQARSILPNAWGARVGGAIEHSSISTSDVRANVEVPTSWAIV